MTLKVVALKGKLSLVTLSLLNGKSTPMIASYRACAAFLVVFIFAAACGGEVLLEEPTVEETTVSAMATCSDPCYSPTYDGNTIYCSGNKCSAGPGWCEADGVYKYCKRQTCAASVQCADGSKLFCSGYNCDKCGNSWVRCGGMIKYCNKTEPACMPTDPGPILVE
jgi:hypothetical protein